MTSYTFIRVDQLIHLLRRFPQCAQIDREADVGAVYAPVDGSETCENWRWFPLDSPDSDLPWLSKAPVTQQCECCGKPGEAQPDDCRTLCAECRFLDQLDELFKLS